MWLYDDDDFLRFGDDDMARANFVEGATNLSPGQHDGTITLTLTCDGNEVVGPLGRSGEGGKEFLIGNINEAEMRAAVQRQGAPNSPIVVSDAIDLWCEE